MKENNLRSISVRNMRKHLYAWHCHHCGIRMYTKGVKKVNDTIMKSAQCLNAILLEPKSDCVQLQRWKNRVRSRKGEFSPRGRGLKPKKNIPLDSMKNIHEK